MKYTKEQISFWMKTAAEANGYSVGRMRNGRLAIYRKPEDREPTRADVILTEAQFVKDMERGWH